MSPGEGREGPNDVQNTSTHCAWVGRIHIRCLGPLTDLYGTPGAPKRARFGLDRSFWGPRRSSEGPVGPDLVPTAPDWPVWARFMLTTHFDLVSGPFWARGGPKRARFGPKCSFWGPRRSSEGPKRPDLVPTTPDWSAWAGLMPTTHFDLVLGPFWVPRGPKRAIWPGP